VEATQGPSKSARAHGVLVTYRRAQLLRVLLQRLHSQHHPLDSLVVVDNDPSPANEAVVAEYAKRSQRVTYLGTAENLGPAGGIALGMLHVLETADDGDWLILFDDDNHELAPSELGDLISFATTCVKVNPRTAGVGQRGGRFSWRRARLRMVPQAAVDRAGFVEVDYLSGNGLPTYRIGAVRDVGPFARELFFGFDDLEYGLRLRARGYAMYKAGRPAGPVPPPKRPQRLTVIASGPPDWRRYYSLRNLIMILRRNHRPVTAARITLTRGVLKPLVSLPFAPRSAAQQLRLNAAALHHGWTGRGGRWVEPFSEDYDPLAGAGHARSHRSEGGEEPD
jgi:glycosyltransferase involved in cell wall biosynthesis